MNEELRPRQESLGKAELDKQNDAFRKGHVVFRKFNMEDSEVSNENRLREQAQLNQAREDAKRAFQEEENIKKFELNFKIGDSVVVERSDKTIDCDWVISSFDSKKGLVIVSKQDMSGQLFDKEVSLDVLLNFNKTEKIGNQEKLVKDKDEFKQFYDDNMEAIGFLIMDGGGEELGNLLYDFLVSKKGEKVGIVRQFFEYFEEANKKKELERVSDKYKKGEDGAVDYLRQMKDFGKKIDFENGDYIKRKGMAKETDKEEKPDGWFRLEINGGATEKGEEMGRFYLNVVPEKVHEVFKKAADIFSGSDIPVSIKTHAFEEEKIEKDIIGRTDKMVVYFDEKDSDRVLDIIRKLHKAEASQPGSNVFKGEIPKFTVEIKDERGEIMKGVGFGQESNVTGGSKKEVSFSDVRKKILKDALNMAVQTGVKPQDLKFEDYFKKACIINKIDPINPAFCLGSDSKFEAIRKAVV